MVTEEQKRQARKTDLYEYLINNHKDDVEIFGNSLRLNCNHSISIKRGYCGFKDFASDETGNSIDLLTKYLDYDFMSAVESLCARSRVTTGGVCKHDTLKKRFEIPKMSASDRHAIEYLEHRGIDRSLIDWLIKMGLCYQCRPIEGRERVVFTNTERNYYEIREIDGTKFCRVLGAEKDYFWYMWQPDRPATADRPNKCYITENAIDAMSLYLMLREDAIYCSIGGVGNYQRIRRAISMGLDVVIAVDNDESGKKCRDQFTECKHLIPQHKDWNEDLLSLRT